MGDLNYCVRDEPSHPVKKVLEDHGFISVYDVLHQPAQATHIQGRCIDQAWIRLPISSNIKVIRSSVNTCVYSDHEIFMTTLKIS